ncbi:MAG: EFR1 family ferrodoxin [Streptococcaceae bacterium]|nr:EFR1 family ferrodoxin [Streptococcaceae bacterium]
MRIALIYFSGVGSTKHIISSMANYLRELDISTEKIPVDRYGKLPLNCDAYIFGTPVYHGEPAKPVLSFIQQLSKLDEAKPALVFSSYGLCKGFTNRHLAEILYDKNLKTVMNSGYRSPASDGTLFLQNVKRFFSFEKNVEDHIKKDIDNFVDLVNNESTLYSKPRITIGAVLNMPNAYFGGKTKLKIRLHEDKCIKCNLCVKNCPVKAITMDERGYPCINREDCLNCYRCIHKCPKLALSLGKKEILKVIK